MITDTHWEGKNLPPLSDHAFMRLLRVQVHTTKPMSQIASELGVALPDLLQWIEDYREPKRTTYQNKGAAPIGKTQRAGGNGWSLAEQARRQTMWERQHAGAAEARKANA